MKFSWLTSLRGKALILTFMTFIAGLGIAGATGLVSINEMIDETMQSALTREINDTEAELQDAADRARVHAVFHAQNPALIATVAGGNEADIQAMFVHYLKAIQQTDTTISTFELTDAKGIVRMRGHKPEQKGDDKSNTPLVKAALEGRLANGATISPTSGEASFDTVVPIKQGDKLIGTLKVGARLTTNIAKRLKERTGVDVIFIGKGKVNSSTLPSDADLEPLLKEAAGLKAQKQFDYAIKGATYLAVLRPMGGDSELVAGVLFDKAPFVAKLYGFLRNANVIGFLALALILPIVFLMVTFKARQIEALTRHLADISTGQVEKEVPHRTVPDEVGKIAQAIEAYRQNVMHTQKLEADAGGASERAAQERSQLIKTLTSDFETRVRSLVNQVRGGMSLLSETIADVRNVSSHAAQNAAQVTQSVSATATYVASSAAAVAEMSQSVKEIERGMRMATDTTKTAKQSGESAERTVSVLLDDIGRVKGVLQLIQNIASQTNLLALNATIEAARAGEAGRGFAVVAQEVKSLATLTSRSTADIDDIVQSMQQNAQQTTQAVLELTGALGAIDDQAGQIMDAISQQMLATQEIAEQIERVAADSESVAGHAVSIRSATEDVQSRAGELVDSAQQLSDDIGDLDGHASDFLLKVRHMAA